MNKREFIHMELTHEEGCTCHSAECRFNLLNDVKLSRMSNREVLLNGTSGIDNDVAPYPGDKTKGTLPRHAGPALGS